MQSGQGGQRERKIKAIRLLGALACALLISVAGCGGSGGSSGGSTVVLPVAADQTSSKAAVPAQAVVQPAEPSKDPILIEAKISVGGSHEVERFKTRAAGMAPTPAQISLGALTVQAPTIQKSALALVGLPTKIGVARPISDTASQLQVSALMGWTTLPNGDKVSAMRFVSPDAKGVRLGLLIKGFPLGATVRFYADSAGKIYEIPGQEILTTIQQNVDAGDSSDAAHTYWSPNMGGEAITIEVEVPPGAPTDAVQISVPSLSHVLADIRKLDSIAKVGEASSCTMDVSCSSTYNELSKSVALMDFVDSGDDYVCTGTLLNDRSSSGTPYFLSANHCISNQTVASTLYTLWFYKSASCNSTQVDPKLAAMVSGATLLYSSADTDTSFMRLNTTPPAGTVYAGSSAFPLGYYDDVYGVSHPKGDLQKYTLGDYLGTGKCTGGTCASSSASSAQFLRVRWTQGATEGGSSGSGLFVKLNTKDYLVGQLFGGYGSCQNPLGNDYYGRFDKAYQAGLSQWLGATSGTVRVPIYRLYNRRAQSHFYTADPAERDNAIQHSLDYSYDGIAFYAYGAAGTASDTVFRFYDAHTGEHFYTINSSERDNIKATIPWLSFEGPSWYANIASGKQTSAMYRFFNTQNGTHFYTINATERDTILQRYPQYSFEGVGYYAWTGP
ncbi:MULTISPECIES: serine protease [unclassified Variovorax]|jgi:lysyl endopeptidase|uniref:serine protease n=1 Tax=unclassified Variovorax TaxID=663243 RepID=UPI002B22B04E|nr:MULTISPECIES: serine protease [unclassified Variovorax]MEB0056390.1 serine protease [Variovorax sp. LG9.2]MEB0110561.1 serine protease [Variovorax sp. RTB1]